MKSLSKTLFVLVCAASLTACALPPRATDLHGVLIELVPNERPHPNAGGTGIGSPVLAGGALAGSLLAQVGKAILIDAATKPSAGKALEKERESKVERTIYNAPFCDATVRLPNQEVIKMNVQCWYMVRTKAHTPGSTVYVRYGKDGQPYVPHLAL